MNPALIEGPYDSDMERRIMQGRFNCAGEYRLAPAAPASWPASEPVPLRPVPGLRNAPEGTEEGDLCMRGLCLGKLENMPSDRWGGCTCFINPPCGHCMSIVPQCPECGHREPEPD